MLRGYHNVGRAALGATLLVLSALVLSQPGESRAEPAQPLLGTPAPLGALSLLAGTPLAVAGDAAAGAGLVGAGTVATLADAVSLADRNRWVAPVLRGAASRTLHALAYGLSWSGTSLCELLRWEDIERLPEPFSAYGGSARFVGRFDTARSGASALGLAVRDAVAGPLHFILRGAGARRWDDRVSRWRHEARVRALGPEPLDPSPYRFRAQQQDVDGPRKVDGNARR